MGLCNVQPVSAFLSTNLNSKINCYKDLGERILRNLGHPMINVEVHPDQLFDAISQSVDFYTVYCGYTKEYLIFDSNLYENNKGIRIDHLFTIANNNFNMADKLDNAKIGPDPDFEVDRVDSIYVSLSAIPKTFFSSSSALSGSVPDEGITKMQLVDQTTFSSMTAFDSSLTSLFQQSNKEPFTVSCGEQESVEKFNNIFDYDIMDYRKVIDVVNFEEGTTTGVNTLFSLENTLMQQNYFAGIAGNFGFDMLSWHTVKDWIDTREKLFATKRDIMFDPRTQHLRLYPQPKNTTFYGLLECYVERPLRDLVKEKWVLEYATAITKIMWGRTLTKISGTQLLGGGYFNGENVLSEGLQEKDKLEQLLVDGAYGGADPLGFMVF